MMRISFLTNPLSEKSHGRELLRHCIHGGAGEADADGDGADGGAQPGPVQGLLLHQQGVYQVMQTRKKRRNGVNIPAEHEIAV